MALQTYTSTIVKIVQETPSSRTYTFDLGGEIAFLPGQFVIVEWPEKLPGIKRSYSISSSPLQKKCICLTFKKEGRFTTTMFDDAAVGDKLIVRGPIGHFVLDEFVKKDIVFLAGGTGIAPFRSMIQFMLEKKIPRKMTLFYSSKTPEEFIFYRELQALQAQFPQFTVLFTATRCKDPSWNGFCERISVPLIKKTVANCKECIFYICGPKEMVDNLAKALEDEGIEKSSIKIEKWG